MRKFSDMENYEVELTDKEGKKQTFQARPRCFDLLKEIEDLDKKYSKLGDSKLIGYEKDYEALGIIFGVPKDVLKAYSHDMIVQIANDYNEYRQKKLFPQEKETSK